MSTGSSRRPAPSRRPGGRPAGAAARRRARAGAIRALFFDVDGVLTDGGIVLGSEGHEAKRFDVKDGMGVTLAREAGLLVGIITGRSSEAVARRGAELAMDEVVQGAKDKLAALREVAGRRGLALAEVGYMGDDLQDLAALLACGFSATPADGEAELRSRVDLVTERRAGFGAAREAIEFVLRAQGRWDATVRRYGG